MSKKTKKRNKPYTGENAVGAPVLHRYQAVTRSPLGEWWHDNKKRVRVYAIVAGVAIMVVFLVVELVDLLF
jgi:hypothetical protein